MRFMVDYQLKEYRASVTYPLTCWRSGFALRRGMKTDVDHIGDPFIKIAEDFLRFHGMKFTDVVLKGRANAKRFKQDAATAAWEQWHKEKAVFALVLSSENRSAGCGDYVSDPELLGSFDTEGAISLDF